MDRIAKVIGNKRMEMATKKGMGDQISIRNSLKSTVL
jgi:hypothetical protein